MRATHCRAFSLVELFVVIALIALLAAIGVGVSTAMSDAGRIRATQLVIETLDQTLDSYVTTRGTIPPELVAIELREDFGSFMLGDTVYLPAIDGRLINTSGTEPNHLINSIGVYLVSIERFVDVEGVLSHVDARFVRNYDLADDGQPSMRTVFDAWGNPIRYVHPRFDGILEEPGTSRALGEPGAPFDDILTELLPGSLLPGDTARILIGHADSPFPEVRRSRILQIDRDEARTNPGLAFPIETDADGGVCAGQRPYFYSAGPDGDPSTIEDNIYTRVPEFVDPF